MHFFIDTCTQLNKILPILLKATIKRTKLFCSKAMPVTNSFPLVCSHGFPMPPSQFTWCSVANCNTPNKIVAQHSITVNDVNLKEGALQIHFTEV